jgi:hypothetical protein
MSRKARRLAVALKPRWPRWGSLVLATISTGTFAAVLLSFYWFGGKDYAPHRAVLYGIVVGGFLLACIFGWTREFVRWLNAGRAQVEISREPVSPGQEWEYYVLVARDHSSIREFEARLLCRRQVLRYPVEEVVSVLLPAPEIEPHGRQAVVRGTLRFPDGPASVVQSHELRVEWLIRIRVVFEKTAPFIEEFPLRVVAQ